MNQAAEEQGELLAQRKDTVFMYATYSARVRHVYQPDYLKASHVVSSQNTQRASASRGTGPEPSFIRVASLTFDDLQVFFC